MASSAVTGEGVVVREPPVCYYIRSKTSGLVLEVKDGNFHPKTYAVMGKKLSDSGDASRDQQCWYFEQAEGRYVYIESKLNGLVLDIKGHSHSSGSRLILYPKKPPPNLVSNQRWKIEGSYIQTQLNQTVVTVKGEEKVGSYVAMFPRGQYSHQEWVFEKVEDPQQEKSDCYFDHSQVESNHTLNRSNGTSTDSENDDH